MITLIILGLLLILASAVSALILLIRALRKKPLLWLRWAAPAAFLGGLVLVIVGTGEIRALWMLLEFLGTAAAIITAVLAVVQRLRKRPAARHAWAALLLFLAAFALRLLNTRPLCDVTQIFGILLLLNGVPMLAALLIRLIRKKPAPVLRWAAPGLTCAAALLLAVTPSLTARHYAELEKQHELSERSVQVDYDFVVEDGAEPIEIVEVDYDPLGYSDRISVYGSSELYRLFGSEKGTAEGCRAAIAANPEIPDRMKAFFADFVGRIATVYPQADLTVLQHNLKTLHVEECSRMDYMMVSLSPDSLGVYRNDQNAIYIPEGTQYIEGEFGFQALLHEFCHAARDCWLNGSSAQKAYFSYCPESTLLLECMNSVFSCSLLNYYEWDIAYQVPSNYLRIMLECMDNYELADYINHGDTYFYRKLDETAGYRNYAKVLWQLITLQRSDWENDRIDIDEAEYYPIYDFLCALYYDRYLQPDMTAEEARQVADDLVYKAFFDAPEGYKINEQRFYDNLDARLSAAP